MRWKLLIITSLVAGLINTGGIYLLVYLMNAYLTLLRETIGIEAVLLFILLVVTTLACIFVYRHTAQRRKLQAALTAIFSIILTFAALFIIAQVLFERSYGERLLPITTQRSLI
jgi:O-antigen ligase